MIRSLVLLPPHGDWPAWGGPPPDNGEDLERPYRILATRNFTYRRVELHRFPLNPAARAHPLFRAIDPIRALRVLTARRAEIAICFFESSALVMLLLRRLLRFRGKVVIVDLGTPEWRPRRALLNFVVPRADAILPYSVAQAAAIRSAWPAAKLVIPVQAQVDTDLYRQAPDAPDGPVLAVGDDGSRDYGTLLAAAPGVLGPIVIRSKRLTNPQVPGLTVLASPLPFLDYRDLLASASIIVLPLHPFVNGGGTSVIVQAMATGKAVVVSASPGVIDYVEDGVTALVVPCGDAGALRDAVNRLLTDHDLRRRMGAAGRERAMRYNSYEAWADTLESVARQVSASN